LLSVDESLRSIIGHDGLESNSVPSVTDYHVSEMQFQGMTQLVTSLVSKDEFIRLGQPTEGALGDTLI
jgi:hypothetical protein